MQIFRSSLLRLGLIGTLVAQVFALDIDFLKDDGSFIETTSIRPGFVVTKLHVPHGTTKIRVRNMAAGTYVAQTLALWSQEEEAKTYCDKQINGAESNHDEAFDDMEATVIPSEEGNVVSFHEANKYAVVVIR
ncbi:Uu.00g037260.m01.CDS01 [Anthostomella pinea]|uniref:Uu.00g037260.m01.CDS01 n=1 Tax=Anthostomella pinea TaxID=933095 RepID=A0AAI8V4N6_9PEZI|nr:Uu.00g037260.m01.CDS01 [Anthostomella pinea]